MLSINIFSLTSNFNCFILDKHCNTIVAHTVMCICVAGVIQSLKRLYTKVIVTKAAVLAEGLCPIVTIHAQTQMSLVMLFINTLK